MALRRADAADFAGAMAPGGPLFDSAAAADGPFAASRIEPSQIERVVGEMIWRHKGRAQALPLERIVAATGKDERTIKGVVEQLVVAHRARIGGYRGGVEGRVGYAAIVDAEDLAAAVGPYRSQIFAMWRRLRVLLSKHELAELHGQLAMEE